VRRECEFVVPNYGLLTTGAVIVREWFVVAHGHFVVLVVAYLHCGAARHAPITGAPAAA